VLVSAEDHFVCDGIDSDCSVLSVLVDLFNRTCFDLNVVALLERVSSACCEPVVTHAFLLVDILVPPSESRTFSLKMNVYRAPMAELNQIVGSVDLLYFAV